MPISIDTVNSTIIRDGINTSSYNKQSGNMQQIQKKINKQQNQQQQQMQSNNNSNKTKKLAKIQSKLLVKQKIQSIKQQMNQESNVGKQLETNKLLRTSNDEDDEKQDPITASRKNNENLKRFESDLESSGKVLLHRVIKFKESSPLEDQNTILKRKYKPINSLSSTSATANNKSSKATTTATQTKQKEEELDDNVLHPPKKVLFPVERVESMMPWSKIRKIGSGLRNIGNTCFMNAVLQCLTYCAPLANFMQTQEHSKTCKIEGFCIFCSLERHINLALSSNGKSITPKEIAGNLRKFAPNFRLGRQEDSHEFIRFVVEGLQKVCLSKHPKGSINSRDSMTTVIGSIFGGYLQSQVKCTVCNYESNTFDPFMDLSVDINQADSLTRAFQRFVKADILDGANKYKCCKCKKLVKATKRMTVHVAPPILTVQLKRFSFLGFHGGKISKPVQFDPVLNLTPYMTNGNNEIVYDLYGVLVHAGSSTNSGHYYCYTKSSSGIWHGLNDDDVNQVSQSTVLAQRAYILFYSKRVTPNNTPVSSTESSPSLRPTKNNPSMPLPKELLTAQIESLVNSKNSKKRKADDESEDDEEKPSQKQLESTSSPKLQSQPSSPKLKSQPSSPKSQPSSPKSQPSSPNLQPPEKKKKIESTSENNNEQQPTKPTKITTSSSVVKQWDEKPLDDIKQKLIDDENTIAAKTGQQLRASRDKDSQFDFKIAKWDHIEDDSEIAKARKDLMKDESLKDVVHKKDSWDEEFDKGRAKKLKKKKNLNFNDNQFNKLSADLQKKKDDQLRFGEQPIKKKSNNNNNRTPKFMKKIQKNQRNNNK